MQHLARFSATNVRQFSSQCGAKPPVSVVHTLKDGRTVTVRRLQVHEEPQLRSYVAVPKQILDALGGDELHDRAVRSHFFNAQTPGRDALAALLKDKVVGTTEIDPEPEDYEPSVDGGFVREQGLSLSQVCVSRMAVDPEFQGLGVGRALKRAQVVAAAQAGYQAVVSETCRPAVKRIVESEGGVVQEGMGSVWTLLPVNTAAAGKASQDTNSGRGGESG